MTQLLVSVRSVSEAAAALEGGAAVIDVKEPTRGSLGAADLRTLEQIVAFVAGRRAVSAALGELLDDPALPPTPLSFVKFGLAGCRNRADWGTKVATLVERVQSEAHTPVIAAYADAELAQAPPVGDVLDAARRYRAKGILLDTYRKATGTLLDWLTLDAIIDMCRTARAAGLQIALAGSLGAREIPIVRRARPDFIAVRGAACAGGERQKTISVSRVQLLAVLTGGEGGGLLDAGPEELARVTR